MKLNRSGDWEHIDAKDGDKPVFASRLLAKRLHVLHPSLRKDRGPAPKRRAVIFGLRFDGPPVEANQEQVEPNMEANMEAKLPF